MKIKQIGAGLLIAGMLTTGITTASASRETTKMTIVSPSSTMASVSYYDAESINDFNAVPLNAAYLNDVQEYAPALKTTDTAHTTYVKINSINAFDGAAKMVSELLNAHSMADAIEIINNADGKYTSDDITNVLKGSVGMNRLAMVKISK